MDSSGMIGKFNSALQRATGSLQKMGATGGGSAFAGMSDVLRKASKGSVSSDPSRNTLGDRANFVAGAFNSRNEKQQGEMNERFGNLDKMASSEMAQKAGISDMLGKGAKIARAASGDPTAIAGLVTDRIGEIKEGLSNTMGYAKQAVTGKTIGQVGGGALRAADSAIGTAIPMSDAMPARLMLKFGAAMAESVDRLREWTDSLHEGNMQFAEFSGAMGAVKAKADVDAMQLSRQRGDRRAGDAATLSESRSNLNNKMAPIEDLISKVQGKFATVGNNILAAVIDLPSKLAEKILGKENNGDLIDPQVWMAQVGEEQWFEAYGKSANEMQDMFRDDRKLQ